MILDTDHLSILEGQHPGLCDLLHNRLRDRSEEGIVTTIVSYEEQTRGWMAYRARVRSVTQEIEAYRKLRLHLETFRTIAVLEIDELAAVEYQRLKSLRIRVGSSDLRIAAVVLAHDATLLSRNLSDFRQVPGLRVEDWTT